MDHDQVSAPQTGKHIQKTKDFIPVPTGLLDDLASLSGEITVIRNMVNKLVRSLEIKFSGEKDIQSLGELFNEMHKINSIIQTKITDLRKIPVAGILKPIARILRDISKETLKKYRFSIEGETLRIDNSLAQACSNSLIHLIRNSADHGIESPEARQKSGKSEAGQILISCKEDRDQIVITVSDDGKGLDLARIKAKALEKNLCSETKLKEMSDYEIMELIFLPGFSTAANVTDISGRGVGMDMVRASVAAVGGQIKIKSTLGQGSSFSLHLPIPRSILIINSLLVSTSNRQFAIPQDDILRVLRIDPEEFDQYLLQAGGGKVLFWQNQLYPLIHLNQVLKIPDSSLQKSPPTIDILILKSEHFCYALQVENILDIEEIVVKRIQDCFNYKSIFSGATFLGDGQVGLILDGKNIGKISDILNTYKSIQSTNRVNEHLISPESEQHSDYVLFKINSKTIFGAPLKDVYRLEFFENNSIQRCAGKSIIVYRDTLMPLVKCEDLLNLKSAHSPTPAQSKTLSALVIQKNQHYIALQVDELLDIARTQFKIDRQIRDRPEILGNVQIDAKTVTIIDLEDIKNRHFKDL
jgi:two-component system chemotaxis sensor kinase CheA